MTLPLPQMEPPHLARLEREGRPAKFDYSISTEQKRRTVEQLRRHYR